MEPSSLPNHGLQETAQCAEIQQLLLQASSIEDPLFRELAFDRLDGLRHEARSLAAGEIVFMNTDTWRSAYQALALRGTFLNTGHTRLMEILRLSERLCNRSKPTN